MNRIIAVVVTVVGLATWPGQGRTDDVVAVSAEQLKILGVETSGLEQPPVMSGQRFPGRVVVPPDRTRLMNAPLGGRIERMLARVDSVVHAGDVLAELQSPALARAQADYLVAYNKEQLLKATLDREQSLAPFGAVAKKQVVVTQSEYEQARATTAERRQALIHYGMSEGAVSRLTETQALDPQLTITAPIDGVVQDVTAVPGQTVEALAAICRLVQLTPLWVEIQVPAGRAADFQVGAEVRLRDVAAAGRLVSVGTSVEATAQTVILRAEFDAAEAGLRPGQVVEAAVVPTARVRTEWRVPSGAVVRRGNDAFVFVKSDTGFTATPVTVQEELPEFTLIAGDFRGDERIAVRGLAALKGAWQGLGGVD